MLAIALGVLLVLTSSALGLDREPGRPPPTARYVEGQLLVKFDTKTATAATAAAHAELGATEVRRFGNVEGLALVQLQPGASVGEALERYRKRPDVKYVSRNYIRSLAAVPNDPRFLDGSLWALQNNGTPSGALTPPKRRSRTRIERPGFGLGELANKHLKNVKKASDLNRKLC